MKTQTQTQTDQPQQPVGATSVTSVASVASVAESYPFDPNPNVFFRSVRWTPDGTTLVSVDSASVIATYALPADLLSSGVAGSGPCPRLLTPNARVPLPEPCAALAVAPYFSLQLPETQAALVACRDHPIHLRHLFSCDDARARGESDGGASGVQRGRETTSTNSPDDAQDAPILCTYKLINAQTEAYITPSSILWPGSGSHFLVGSANRIDYFDAYRPGNDGPTTSIPTIPSRRHISKGSGVGMRGIVSSLSLAPSSLGAPLEFNAGLVAAGTWTRWMGLYDLTRSPHAVGHWSIAHVLESTFAGPGGETEDVGGGAGIAQTTWSPCGRYLVVNERGSEALLVYDVRNTGKSLSALLGRRAGGSLMRLGCDAYPGTAASSSFEVWGGCADGSVMVWEGVGGKEGRVQGWRWQESSGRALGDEEGQGGALGGPATTRSDRAAPVGSVALHGCGSVLATCSGGWERGLGGSDDGAGGARKVIGRSKLSVWVIGGQGDGDEAGCDGNVATADSNHDDDAKEGEP